MTIEDIKFFVFFLTATLGERRGGCWRCPRGEHRNESVYVRDDCRDGRLRWGCYRCEGGDEFDLLRLVGVRGYGEQLVLLDRLRADFAAIHPDATAPQPSPRGDVGSESPPRPVYRGKGGPHLGYETPEEMDAFMLEVVRWQIEAMRYKSRPPADVADRARAAAGRMTDAEKLAVVRASKLSTLHEVSVGQLIRECRRDEVRLYDAEAN